MQLVDYKVRVLDDGLGTGARVRVLIESTDGERRWGTVGLSSNVVEASWQALIDSVEFKLHKDDAKAPARSRSMANGHNSNGAKLNGGIHNGAKATARPRSAKARRSKGGFAENA